MKFWSIEHVFTFIPTFLIMIAFSILLKKILKNKSYEEKMLPIKIISVILVVIEIGKQITSFIQGYNLYHIPLHFCSIFLFVLPLMAFYRGKYHEAICSFSCSTMMVLFIGMIIIPNVIYNSNNILNFFKDYLCFHTVIFHNLVIFSFLLTLSLNLHKEINKRQNLKVNFLATLIFVVIACSMSYILQTNYSNFLFTTVGLLNELVLIVGEIVGDPAIKIIYSSSLVILHLLIVILAYYLFGVLNILVNKIK